MYDYKCKVNLRTYKLFVKSVIGLKWRREDPHDKEMCISIYISKKLELHSKIDIIYCVIGFEGGCKFTTNRHA